MHTVVAIKQVPDTSNVRINPETGTLIREGVPAIVNPYDAHAVELAVRFKEKFGGTVTVITMGPPKAAEALVECVEQGADRGILITDRKFSAADTLATSYVLARTIEALQAEGPVVATRLGVPLISYAVAVESFDPASGAAVIHRQTERGIEVLQTRLPALLTVEKDVAAIGRAPLPNLIRAAQYTPETWTATEPVAFDLSKVGIKGSPTIVGKAYTPPPKQAGGRVAVAEQGVEAAVAAALAKIKTAGVIQI